MLNKAMIIGRIGQDPELRYGQSGTPFLNLGVATDETFTDRDGNRQEKTEWHRVVVYDRMAQNCATYLRKGSLVYVEGSLRTRKWQDNQGQERQTTEIRAQRVQFLDRKGAGSDAAQGGQNQYESQAPQRDAGYRRNGGSDRSHSGWQDGRQPPSRPGPDQDRNGYQGAGSEMDEVPFG